MASDKGKTAAQVGVGITAGALAALILTRRVRGEILPSGEVISLDDPTMQALLGILEHIESLDIDVDDVIERLGGVTNAINTLSVALGAKPIELQNPPDITAFRVLTTALDTPVQLPDRLIPYDMELVIKALPTNRGTLFIAPGPAEALNPNSSYWIIGNEAVEYKIRNANHIWMNAPTFGGIGIAGEGVVCTVEQASRR